MNSMVLIKVLGVNMDKTVIELFAGVGGFRVGLNNIEKIDKDGRAVENGHFDFVWANQFEPSTKSQHAFDCYEARFGKNSCSNSDIALVNKKEIPDHTLLVGGFPCQDYSVARSKSTEKGIEGKKGVLWWQINEILEVKKPPFVLLENVDRLLKSPARQRGRDFGMILRCFYDRGYDVEWRVINAADYGHPQRRRRIFIFAYKDSTIYRAQQSTLMPMDILTKDGIFAKGFPVKKDEEKVISVDMKEISDLIELSNKFSFTFNESGYMHDGVVYTKRYTPKQKESITLRQIVSSDVPEDYYLDEYEIASFKYCRGSKKIKRFKPNGEPYIYSEGSMSEYDSLDLPGRTMLTSEGTINRSTHIIMDPKTDRLRFLTPIECERLNEFPDNWTKTDMSESRRRFMMGNALVCGIIETLGKQIERIIENEPVES